MFQNFERSRRHLADERLSTQTKQNEILSEESHQKDLENINANFNNSILNVRIQELDEENLSLKAEVRKLKQEKIKLQATVEHYETLLNNPMNIIAASNDNFRKHYDDEMLIMADWMTSQKAFKELAIEFGFAQGLDAEEVTELGKQKKIDVLDSKHNPNHKTNATDSTFLANKAEKLKQDIKK